MYGAYLAEKRQQVSHGAAIQDRFLVWHRTRQWDTETSLMVLRGGRHEQARPPTMVVACR